DGIRYFHVTGVQTCALPIFRAFEGIGPRRFVDLFSLALGSGRPVRRKQKDADGARIAWKRGEGSHPRLPLDPRSYLEREDDAATIGRASCTERASIPAAARA